MLTGKIYLRAGDHLVAMQESAYDAEDILQQLLADYPDLLAGDQMRPSAPRRWLLIEREAGIEDTAGGLPRWSLDHLFLDQDAIPTLVEVKRSSDTRIRREVVGQMLDYAANVVAHWPPGELRTRLAERMGRDADPDGAVSVFLGATDDAAIDLFWETADANMAARRLRMVFVADVIPAELLRIIEFLNEAMVRAEVFGVEVRQFVGEGHQTLVPRVLGRTAAADQVKQGALGGGSRRAFHWTPETLLAQAAELGGPRATRLMESVRRWSADRGVVPTIGVGKGGPIYIEAWLPDGRHLKIANVNATGQVTWSFDVLKQAAPFEDAEPRLECLRRLNEIPGVAIEERYAIGATWPTLPPGVLDTDEALDAFYGVVAWTIEQMTGAR